MRRTMMSKLTGVIFAALLGAAGAAMAVESPDEAAGASGNCPMGRGMMGGGGASGMGMMGQGGMGMMGGGMMGGMGVGMATKIGRAHV